MYLVAHFLLASVFITFLSLSAYAGDVVEISSNSGYPGYNNSLERVVLRVERLNSQLDPTRKLIAIDEFFEKVSSVLTEHGIDRNWELAIIDYPFIRISIEISGTKLQLLSSHIDVERSGESFLTEGGIKKAPKMERDAILAIQSEKFRRNRDAFDAILRLTLERAHSKFSP
jgi:hypothetical protein